jgi:hypothetical protein
MQGQLLPPKYRECQICACPASFDAPRDGDASSTLFWPSLCPAFAQPSSPARLNLPTAPDKFRTLPKNPPTSQIPPKFRHPSAPNLRSGVHGAQVTTTRFLGRTGAGGPAVGGAPRPTFAASARIPARPCGGGGGGQFSGNLGHFSGNLGRFSRFLWLLSRPGYPRALQILSTNRFG